MTLYAFDQQAETNPWGGPYPCFLLFLFNYLIERVFQSSDPFVLSTHLNRLIFLFVTSVPVNLEHSTRSHE